MFPQINIHQLTSNKFSHSFGSFLEKRRIFLETSQKEPTAEELAATKQMIEQNGAPERKEQPPQVDPKITNIAATTRDETGKLRIPNPINLLGPKGENRVGKVIAGTAMFPLGAAAATVGVANLGLKTIGKAGNIAVNYGIRPAWDRVQTTAAFASDNLARTAKSVSKVPFRAGNMAFNTLPAGIGSVTSVTSGGVSKVLGLGRKATFGLSEWATQKIPLLRSFTKKMNEWATVPEAKLGELSTWSWNAKYGGKAGWDGIGTQLKGISHDAKGVVLDAASLFPETTAAIAAGYRAVPFEAALERGKKTVRENNTIKGIIATGKDVETVNGGFNGRTDASKFIQPYSPPK